MPPFFKSWLWRLVYIKLLISFIWITPLQLPVAVPILSKPEVSVSSITLTKTQQADYANTVIHAQSPVHNVVVERHQNTHVLTTERLPDTLMLLWLIGVAVWAERLFREWNAVRVLLSECAPVNDKYVIDDMIEMCVRLGIHKTPTLMVHSNCGPMLVGMRYPTIILPEGVMRQMSKDDLRPALAHELAHLKRGDLLWSLVASIAQGLFFFNPLIWLSRRELVLAQEMACDAFSIEALAFESDYYGQMLLSTIKNCVSSRPRIITAGIGESYYALERRLIAMSRAIKLSRRQTFILVIVLIGLALAGVVPWRAKVRAQNNIHIVYKSVWSRPALPKEYVSERLAGTHEDDLKQWGPRSKWTNGMIDTEKAIISSWRARYKPQADEVGQADYWGTPTDSVWVFDRFGNSYFTSYNGKYVAQGQPSTFGLRPRRKDEGIGYLLISNIDRGRFEESVPYLGFVQPGLSVYSTERKAMTKTVSGWEEHSLGLPYTFQYNRHHQPVSLMFGLEKYEFSEYVRFKGIDYPKTVVHTKYWISSGKRFVDEVTTYKALSIDNKPLRKTGFDAERPPKGVHIQDLRPEFTNDTGRELNYTYRNTKLTVTETSAMLSRNRH